MKMTGMVTAIAGSALLLAGQAAWSEVQEAKMKTEGMICSQCVYGLEKVLKKKHGLKEIGFDAETQVVNLEFKDSGRPVDWAQLRLDTYANGFTPKETWLVLVGRAVEESGALVFEVTGTGQKFKIAPSELAAKLRKHAGKRLEIRAQLIADGEEKFRLSWWHKLLGKKPKRPEIGYKLDIEEFNPA